MDYKEALDICKKAALAAGEIQKENFGRKNLLTETKSSEIDLVTEIDKKSEELIIGMIKEKYPEHGFIAEETGVSGKSDYMWVIDPLDGTTNYSQGLPIFAVSIALQYMGETKLGVVYLPMTGQLFEAMVGEGAYINGERIEVSDKESLGSSVLATGFPYDVHTHKDNNVKYFNYFITRTRAIRRMGAAAYDIACVAAGRFDGYWEMTLKPWDVAAALLMVTEAGGTVEYFREDRGISVIVGNKKIVDEIKKGIEIVDETEKSLKITTGIL